MAIVVVQVGQCGNQLGEELWRQLALSTKCGVLSSPFFTHDRKARCVLVDSEPKVVHGVYERHKDLFRANNVIYGQSGRGNHWALGYYGINDVMSERAAENAAVARPFQLSKDQRSHDNHVVRDALRAIHAETRRTDDADGFEAVIILHSLVGGTGSGMATRLIEKIRYYFIEPPDGVLPVDECAEAEMMRRDGLDGMLMEKRRALHLVSITVAPQTVGELSTQGLNAALTLHSLQENVDAVLLLRNDDCFGVPEGSVCGMRPPSRGNVRSTPFSSPSLSSKGRTTVSSPSTIRSCTTFGEVNEVFVSLLMPIFFYGRSTGALSELVLKCSPNHIDMNNILTVVSTPLRSYAWFRESVVFSRFYLLSGVKQHMPGACPNVPIEQLHRAKTIRSLDLVSSRVEVKVPKEFLQGCVDRAVPRCSVSMALLQQMEGVLVMNQVRELNASVLFPLLRSAAMKVKAGAFLSTFQDMGLSAECIQAAIREVAARLVADDEDLN